MMIKPFLIGVFVFRREVTQIPPKAQDKTPKKPTPHPEKTIIRELSVSFFPQELPKNTRFFKQYFSYNSWLIRGKNMKNRI